jgi:hypothetical protein
MLIPFLHWFLSSRSVVLLVGEVVALLMLRWAGRL